MTEPRIFRAFGHQPCPHTEALCVLSTVGILESRQGGGRYVTNECNTDILGHILYDYAILEGISLEQMMDVRFLLEPEIARKAAILATQEQKKRIWDISAAYSIAADAYTATKEEFQNIVLLDHKFHQTIVEANKNAFLSIFFALITYSFGIFQHRRYERAEDSKQHWQTLSIEHFDIAKAILAKDGDAAYRAMERAPAS